MATLKVRSGTEASGFPSYFVYIGMAMAIISSTLNGISFVLQKKGILDVEVKMLREGKEVKEGHVQYLKSFVWWSGTGCMAVAEITNLVAYSFAPSVLVAPMGSCSVFVTAVLSTYFLKERLSFEAKVGVFLTVIGSVVVVLQSPNSENPVYTIDLFWTYMSRWWAILWAVICLAALIVISAYVGPRWGKTNVLVYVTAAALGGSWLVQLAGSVGASIIYSFSHWDTENAFRTWGLYVLVLVSAVLAVYQVLTTNRALTDHGAGIVMPIFYVFFTTATMITYAFLFAGASSIPGIQVATLVMGFLVISCGVAILYSFNLRALPKKVVELINPDAAAEFDEEGEDEDYPLEDEMMESDELLEKRDKFLEAPPSTPLASALTVETGSLPRRSSISVSTAGQQTLPPSAIKPQASVLSPLSPAGTLAEPHVTEADVGLLEPAPMPLAGGGGGETGAADMSSVGTVRTAPEPAELVGPGAAIVHRSATTAGNVSFAPTRVVSDSFGSAERVVSPSHTAGEATATGGGSQRHARKVSISAQSQRALSRKNTVGFALDVLSSHAWELDEALLREKYSIGLAPQAHSGSLRRKHPRGYSSESINTEAMDLGHLTPSAGGSNNGEGASGTTSRSASGSGGMPPPLSTAPPIPPPDNNNNEPPAGLSRQNTGSSMVFVETPRSESTSGSGSGGLSIGPGPAATVRSSLASVAEDNETSFPSSSTDVGMIEMTEKKVDEKQ